MELFRVTIPQYIREVKLSNKQRPIYWEWNGMNIKAGNKYILQRYLKRGVGSVTAQASDVKDLYTFMDLYNGGLYYHYAHYVSQVKKPVHPNIYAKNSKRILYDLYDLKPVIANINQAGKPRIIQIKGQDIYSGNIREFTRGAIMEAIKNSYIPCLKDISPVSKYPIKIAMELHDTIDNVYGNKNQRWDVDNRAYPYCKAFPDVLTDLGIIEDDDRLHITQPPVPIFCPIDNHEDRKLVFIIEHDTRDIISNLSIASSHLLTGKVPYKSFTKQNNEITKIKLIKK
jgi:hypothetical protein